MELVYEYMRDDYRLFYRGKELEAIEQDKLWSTSDIGSSVTDTWKESNMPLSLLDGAIYGDREQHRSFSSCSTDSC